MIEDVYFLRCIYLNALEIPQCIECFESRLKRFLVSWIWIYLQFAQLLDMSIDLHMILRSLSIRRCLGMFSGLPVLLKVP